jgi:eukaryotic-like serine/threonine-protein kinase
VNSIETTAIGPGAELCDGRYRLERVIGVGGMASVWLGRDQRLDRPVAVKVLSDTLASDPGYVERFRREAQLAARLSHPNLVKVFDFEPKGRPALIMEYVEGGTLDETAEDPDTTVEPEALATQILGALEHIHAAGIVHRDVKPANVLVARDGRAMLTDFGIAQLEDAPRMTKTGQVIGTLAYMAPEVQHGERATPQSDLYSTGVVLRDHLPDDAPAGLRRLVERLTEPEPGLRPSTAERALSYLDASPASASAAARRAAVARRTTPSPATDEMPESRTHADQRISEDPPPPVVGPRGEAAAGGAPRELPIRGRHVVAGLALLAAVIAAIAVATSGGGDSGDPAASGSADPAAETPASGEEPAPPAEAETETAAPATGAVPEPKADADPAKGAELEQAAFATLQSGDAEKAVKDYEKALAEFPLEARAPGAFDQYPSYAYALYSYGDALLQSGRPDEAVAVLEERLAFDDQRETVEAKLAEAQAAAGE